MHHDGGRMLRLPQEPFDGGEVFERVDAVGGAGLLGHGEFARRPAGHGLLTRLTARGRRGRTGRR